MILYLLYLLHSASVGIKTVLSNPSNKEIDELLETNKSNKFSSSEENKSKEEEASVLVGVKTELSNSSNKEIHGQIETNKSNKFSSSGVNKIKEEEDSKVQENTEINTNISSSKNRTKNGEYVLNRPLKRPGGGKVGKNNTATTISCETASEQENSRKSITDMLGKMEVPDIVQM